MIAASTQSYRGRYGSWTGGANSQRQTSTSELQFRARKAPVCNTGRQICACLGQQCRYGRSPRVGFAPRFEVISPPPNTWLRGKEWELLSDALDQTLGWARSAPSRLQTYNQIESRLALARRETRSFIAYRLFANPQFS